MKVMQVFPPEKGIRASLQIGGSKSISNRLIILREVLQKKFDITNLSDSEDTRLLLNALNQLKHNENHTINVNHAGTDFRFLTAFLAARKRGTYTLTGSERLKNRPISELVNVLKQLGADIHYTERENHPPLKITGKQLRGGEVKVEAGISSQFISSLLLISPLLSSELVIDLKGDIVSLPYIQMSLDLLKAFGIDYEFHSHRIKIASYRNKIASPPSFSVESDWSSASYWYSVCALSKNAEIRLGQFYEQSLQPDSRLVKIYTALGVKTSFYDAYLTLTHEPSDLHEFSYDFTDCPDIALTIACTCLGLGIHAKLNGLKTLQFKESKRIDALKNECQKFGASVISGDDYLVIHPSQKTPDSFIKIVTHNDHRMAMSFAPLALAFPGLLIEDFEVVNKSYPRFWDDLQSLGFRLNLQS
jgi:3-phosphoshikimate 1-carboxyvinyltransferase